jgi:DNA-binding SARP family transcriptional activator
MTGDSCLHFSVLGAFRVERDGQEVDLGPRLQRMLLAILVVDAGRVVPVDRLIDLLWREEPPATAIASVQVYISQLRRVLEPGRSARAPARVLVTQDPGYVLRVADDQVDALRFRALARQAHNDLAVGPPAVAAACLEDALALWRGDPLPEFAGEPWTVAAVARLVEAHDLATEDRIDAWLALGEHAQAAAELEAMVAARPLRERRWAQLIIATYRCGRQADALRAYQRCRAVLAEELGLEPGPELRRLETAVLAQDPALDWRPVPAAEVMVPPAAAPGHDEAHATSPPPTEGPSALSLVGRETELAYLRGRLGQVASGDGGAVALVGEPGAGKTTLAEAAARLAAAAGLRAVWGRCLDTASTPAYWPWSQVLRALPDGPEVATARQRLDGDVEIQGEDSVRQFRAYQAVAAALGEAASSGPLLAIVDDLHAADDASLGLLQLLAGDLHRMPALFLFTVRDTEPSRALGRALGELLRHPGADRVAVGAFTPADVAALLKRLTAQPPPAEVVSALMERTGGNPFYATELVRLIGSEHRRRPLTAADVRALDVPGGIRDVLLRRVGRLPDDTQSLLLVAAVAGPEIQPELLEHLTGLDAEHLLLDLEPAIAAGLVTAAGWGFRFRHPLIHESLYASVGRVERARLHARVAAALEGISSASTAADVAQLAHHYLSAGPFGEPAKAVSYARQAASRAVGQGAWQDAARHLEQALTAVSPTVPDADAIRCDVLVELGQARRSAGLIRQAHRAFGESISLADRIGDQDRMLAAAVAFGAPQLWGPREWGETDTGLIALLERQLDRVGDHDPARRVRILATLATELYFDQAAFRGWGYANQALDAARQLGRPDELGIAVSAYLLSAVVTDHVPQIRAVIDEMLGGDQPKLTPRAEAIVRAKLLTERIRSGNLTRFDTEFPHVWQLATDVLHSPELQGQLRAAEACRYLAAGDAERAAGIVQLVFRSFGDLGNPWREPQRIAMDNCLMLITGTLADHAEQMAARLARPDHPSVPHLAAPAAALGFTLRGDQERARQIASRWFAPPPRSWAWTQAIAFWAQVAIALGVPDPGWLYDQLAPHAGELAVAGVGGDCGGAADSLLAGLAWRLGRRDEAAERAHAGLTLETRVGSPIWINRTTDLISRIKTAP